MDKTIIFEQKMIFWKFSITSSFGGQLIQKDVVEWGRNIMCERTLSSPLVVVFLFNKTGRDSVGI